MILIKWPNGHARYERQEMAMRAAQAWSKKDDTTYRVIVDGVTVCEAKGGKLYVDGKKMD